MNYSVSANGQTWPVSDERELVSYTTSGLVYGEVQVTAINSCGQQSLTTSINIPVSGELTPFHTLINLFPLVPPETILLSVDIDCEEYGSPFISVLISWSVSCSHNVMCYIMSNNR